MIDCRHRRPVDRLAVAPAAEVVHRVEAALDEPDLVGLGVGRPGAAEDDQLDLVGAVADVVVGAQA